MFYVLYFARRLAIGLTIMFIHVDLVQLILSIAITLSVIHIQIPIYVLATMPFLDMSMNIYIICSETLLICFYFNLMVGILSIGGLSINTVGSAGVKIALSALALNALFSLFQASASIYEKACKKRHVKIYPNETTIIQDKGNVTVVEDDIFQRRDFETKDRGFSKRKNPTIDRK